MMAFQISSATAGAGTAITALIPGIPGKVTRIKNIRYQTAGTPHTITILRPVAYTTADDTAVSGQAVIRLDNVSAMKSINTINDEIIATNDYLIVERRDGKYEQDTVSSVSGNDVTMTNVLGGTVSSGGGVWILGELGRASHITLTTTASTTETFDLNALGGIPGQLDTGNAHIGSGDPLFVSVDNVTAAGTLISISGDYVDAAEGVTMT